MHENENWWRKFIAWCHTEDRTTKQFVRKRFLEFGNRLCHKLGVQFSTNKDTSVLRNKGRGIWYFRTWRITTATLWRRRKRFYLQLLWNSVCMALNWTSWWRRNERVEKIGSLFRTTCLIQYKIVLNHFSVYNFEIFFFEINWSCVTCKRRVLLQGLRRMSQQEANIESKVSQFLARSGVPCRIEKLFSETFQMSFKDSKGLEIS